MEEWKTYKLKDICIKVTDGSHFSPEGIEDGYPMFSVKDMLEYGFDYSKCKRISEIDFNKMKSSGCVPQKGDVLVAKDGSFLKQIFVCEETMDEAILSSIAIFRPDTSKVCPEYLCYLIKSPKVYDYISKNCVSGSALPRIVLKAFKEVELDIPSLDMQKSIVARLKCIDDKIRINNRINHNLEEQAQALYKSWFVDFEPFRGGNFVNSELGMIPEGWRVGCYNDIISSTVSGDWGKDREVGNYTHKVSCIRGCDFADVSSGIRGKTPERFVLEKNFQNKRLLDKDIIVEISGGTPTVSTGRICLVSDNLLDKYSGNIVCTNFCRVIRPCSGYSSYVFYSWLDKYNSRVMFGYENGTSGIKNFQISDFMEKEPVIIPPQTVIAQFQTIVDVYQAVIQRNGNERMECETVRDALLPKLMSGELKINDLTC